MKQISDITLCFYFVVFADGQAGYHGGGSALVSTASLFLVCSLRLDFVFS